MLKRKVERRCGRRGRYRRAGATAGGQRNQEGMTPIIHPRASIPEPENHNNRRPNTAYGAKRGKSCVRDFSAHHCAGGWRAAQGPIGPTVPTQIPT